MPSILSRRTRNWRRSSRKLRVTRWTAVAAGEEAALPEEFPSEFADYHRAALAFRRGREHWVAARESWEALLARPPEERRYRTVWATFMLGKLAMKLMEPDAGKWFQQTRALAGEGFKDSLGMAADSYGWEARSEWKQGRSDKAAPLFLTQLALGDESAVISLKALIPDRASVGGILNYGPDYEEQTAWNEEQKRAAADRAASELKAAARDPLLRRLITAHILATSSGNFFFGEEQAVAAERAKRWLAVIDAARLGTVDDAEYLGWAAYNIGNYREAGRWLALAESASPAALWLQAKLHLRAGKLPEAARSMAQAWQSIHEITRYTGWTPPPADREGEEIFASEGPRWSFPAAATGDLAALHLSRAEFVQSLDTFVRGGLWNDAAFVAERVLTADELKAYVDQLPPELMAADGADDGNTAPRRENYTPKLRYLLGRRFVREDRYDDAALYVPPPNDRLLQEYVQALRRGADEKLPKRGRAEAFFHAAWLARYDGMELMGAEGAPDAFVNNGSFELQDIAAPRLNGTYEKLTYDSTSGEQKTARLPVELKPTKQELARLTKNKISPDVRFHYRVVAAALAMKAAPLLPDNTEELADVINTAGQWVKDRDQPGAERYYNVLERRCWSTELGRAASAKHWFVDQRGPWSAKQAEIREALRAELGTTAPDE